MLSTPLDTTADAAEAPKVVKLPKIGESISAAIVVMLSLLLIISVVTNDNYQWDVVGTYLFSDVVVRGLGMTLVLTFISMVLAIVIGTVLAVMKLSLNPVVSSASRAYIWFFRGVPLLVLLVFIYNIAGLYPNLQIWLPGAGLTDIDMNSVLTPFLVAIIAFSLHEAAYMAEIIRAGIQSIDGGQREAASALGMTSGTIFRRVVLPQAMRVILPPTGNQLIGLLKGTSLVSTIAVSDLLYSVQTVYSRTFETIPLLLVATIWYLVVVSVLSFIQRAVESRYSRGFNRAVVTQRAAKKSVEQEGSL